MRYNVNKTREGYTVSSMRKVGGTRRPRMSTIALTDTLVTRADGSSYIIPRRSTTRDARATTRKHTTGYDAVDLANKQRHVTTAADLTPIGNVE